jgi:Ca2+-binding RTX toxin-like protein
MATITGTDGDDTLIGNPESDVIRGLGGNDILHGGASRDLLDGGPGNDVLNGGSGDDIYSAVDAGDSINEDADAGFDEVTTALATYVLGANLEMLTAVSSGPHDFRGNALGNLISGNSENDILRLQDGGGDNARGLHGDDIFYLGAAFDNWDRVDGGEGNDTLVLQGDYMLSIAPGTIARIDGISLQSRTVTRWGQSGTNSYDYALTLSEAVAQAGVQLRINAQSLQAGEDLTFDGSAETDGGRFLVYGGFGTDRLTGGAGNDIFFFEGGRFGAGDRVDGGGGADAVVISGASPVTIEAGAFTQIEALSFSGRFASDSAARPSYDVALHDGNIAPGGTLIVNASSLEPDQTLSFDGSAVSDGRLRIFGGAGGDTLKGGANDDAIQGGGLGDALQGGGGEDRFVYSGLGDSSGTARDVIADFEIGVDKIDLVAVDADISSAGDDAFRFVGESAFSGTAGELRLAFDAQAGRWSVQGDVSGDMAIDFELLVSSGGTAPLTAPDFIL